MQCIDAGQPGVADKKMKLSPDILLNGYCAGVFPMASPELGNVIRWYAPDPRAILPLENMHVSKSLRRTIRQGKFEIEYDRRFEEVMRRCAQPRADDSGCWISEEIIEAYLGLFKFGFAHSVECVADGELVGGLYGVSIGGAFFGESMFHSRTDASKVALYHLVERLKSGGYALLDVQYITDHLASLGVVEIARSDYERVLKNALSLGAKW